MLEREKGAYLNISRIYRYQRKFKVLLRSLRHVLVQHAQDSSRTERNSPISNAVLALGNK